MKLSVVAWKGQPLHEKLLKNLRMEITFYTVDKVSIYLYHNWLDNIPVINTERASTYLTQCRSVSRSLHPCKDRIPVTMPKLDGVM